MIYTSYEMIRDCRAGKAEGWTYFLSNYVPLVGGFLAHYYPGRAVDVDGVVAKLRLSLFASLTPGPERIFVAELRQRVLAAVEDENATRSPEVTIDVETLGRALEPLTLTEKLVVWFETMCYGAADSARLLRMSPETAEKIRGRAAELIRGGVDSWSASLLADNGAALGREAATLSTKECLPAKAFFDVIDGRATWSGREEMERHVKGCWCCLDLYCRFLEAVDILRVPATKY